MGVGEEDVINGAWGFSGERGVGEGCGCFGGDRGCAEGAEGEESSAVDVSHRAHGSTGARNGAPASVWVSSGSFVVGWREWTFRKISLLHHLRLSALGG